MTPDAIVPKFECACHNIQPPIRAA